MSDNYRSPDTGIQDRYVYCMPYRPVPRRADMVRQDFVRILPPDSRTGATTLASWFPCLKQRRTQPPQKERQPRSVRHIPYYYPTEELLYQEPLPRPSGRHQQARDDTRPAQHTRRLSAPTYYVDGGYYVAWPAPTAQYVYPPPPETPETKIYRDNGYTYSYPAYYQYSELPQASYYPQELGARRASEPVAQPRPSVATSSASWLPTYHMPVEIQQRAAAEQKTLPAFTLYIPPEDRDVVIPQHVAKYAHIYLPDQDGDGDTLSWCFSNRYPRKMPRPGEQRRTTAAATEKEHVE